MIPANKKTPHSEGVFEEFLVNLLIIPYANISKMDEYISFWYSFDTFQKTFLPIARTVTPLG